MKKILILEDNIKSATIIEKTLYEISNKIQVFHVTCADKAYPIIVNNRIDIFIVDIILDTSKQGDTSGIKFVKNLRMYTQYKFTPVIFVTSLEDPAIYAFRELHFYGYIEKPFDIRQIQELVVDALTYEAPYVEDKILYFRKDGILYPVNCKSIVYAESSNHKMCFHFENKTELTIGYKSCKQVLEEAEMKELLQCNKGTIINRRHIVNIDLTNSVVTLRGNIRINIGNAYKKRLIEALT